MEAEEDAAEDQDAEQRQQQSWEEIPSDVGKGTFGLIFSRVLIHLSSLFLLPQKLTEEEGTQQYVAGEKRRRRRKRKIHY